MYQIGDSPSVQIKFDDENDFRRGVMDMVELDNYERNECSDEGVCTFFSGFVLGNASIFKITLSRLMLQSTSKNI